MAAHSIPASLSSDEFVEIYSEDGGEGFRQFELFDGEVVERPMANLGHDVIKNVLCDWLNRHFAGKAGLKALVETTFKLNPVITFSPDLMVIGLDRWKSFKRFAEGSPDIAFEIVSSDRADRLQFKIDSYLRHGAKAVCCVYPQHKTVTVFTPGQWCEYSDSASLEFPGILPGFSMPLSEIFDARD